MTKFEDLDSLLKIAHRGASAYEPENTLRSFERAIELKADMIELDVRQTIDGHLVVIHDKTLDRTTDSTGLVSLKTLSEIKELNAGKGERIPTLDEVLDLGRGRVKFVLEIKENGIEDKLVDVISRNELFDEAFVVSFKSNRLKMIKQLEPKIKTGLILFASLEPVRLAMNCGADVVAPFRWFVTSGLVKRARDNGLLTFTWTVDETLKAHKLKEAGVSGIVTNRPDII
jgi:glycerophosphoryl diester phosphodiesterase